MLDRFRHVSCRSRTTLTRPYLRAPTADRGTGEHRSCGDFTGRRAWWPMGNVGAEFSGDAFAQHHRRRRCADRSAVAGVERQDAVLDARRHSTVDHAGVVPRSSRRDQRDAMSQANILITPMAVLLALALGATAAPASKSAGGQRPARHGPPPPRWLSTSRAASTSPRSRGKVTRSRRSAGRPPR